MTLTINQQRQIRNLRFEIRWSRNIDLPPSWNASLTMPLVKSRSGLRSLRIFPECCAEKASLDHYGELKCIKILSTLPLSNVEIAVRNLPYLDRFWTEDDRKAVARNVRAMLLGPNSAEIYA